jgi:hypothetical protein
MEGMPHRSITLGAAPLQDRERDLVPHSVPHLCIRRRSSRRGNREG